MEPIDEEYFTYMRVYSAARFQNQIPFKYLLKIVYEEIFIWQMSQKGHVRQSTKSHAFHC